MNITLQEKRQESNGEHQENGNDATADPIEHWDEVIATGLTTNDIALRVDLADYELLVERSDVEH